MTGSASTTEPSARSSTTDSWRQAHGPAGLVGVDEEAGRDLLALAQLPRCHAQPGNRGARAIEGVGLTDRDVAFDAIEAEVALLSPVVVEGGQVPAPAHEVEPVGVDLPVLPR